MDNTNKTTHQPAIITDLCQQLCNITTWQGGNETDDGTELKTLSEMPRNAIAGKQYQGINIILLWAVMREKNYDSYEWATFKQWSANGQSIRRGEKGTVIIHYSLADEEINGKTKTVANLKMLRVFNRSQLKKDQTETSAIEQKE